MVVNIKKQQISIFIYLHPPTIPKIPLNNIKSPVTIYSIYN